MVEIYLDNKLITIILPKQSNIVNIQGKIFHLNYMDIFQQIYTINTKGNRKSAYIQGNSDIVLQMINTFLLTGKPYIEFNVKHIAELCLFFIILNKQPEYACYLLVDICLHLLKEDNLDHAFDILFTGLMRMTIWMSDDVHRYTHYSLPTSESFSPPLVIMSSLIFQPGTQYMDFIAKYLLPVIFKEFYYLPSMLSKMYIIDDLLEQSVDILQTAELPWINDLLIQIANKCRIIFQLMPDYVFDQNILDNAQKILRNSPNIQKYTHHGDAGVNLGLRREKIDSHSLKISESIIHALDSIQWSNDVYLYRGSMLSHKPEIGSTISDKGYLSKSVDGDIAQGFITGDCCLLWIQYPGKSKQLPVWLMSKYPTEQEVLSYPGECFQVVDKLTYFYKYTKRYDVFVLEYRENLYTDLHFTPIIDTNLDNKISKIGQDLREVYSYIVSGDIIIVVKWNTGMDVLNQKWGNDTEDYQFDAIYELLMNRIIMYPEIHIYVVDYTQIKQQTKFSLQLEKNGVITVDNIVYQNPIWLTKLMYNADKYDIQGIHIPIKQIL